MWQDPPTEALLEKDEVHVWRATLARTPPELACLRDLLNDEERTRADRLRNPAHGERFTAGRGILRLLLGKYLDAKPCAVPLASEAHGKPFVSGNTGLRFNLSHSNDTALFAFARERELGIDIQELAPIERPEALARRFFSAQEIEALRTMPPDAYALAFYTCWTRKEAYLKARGEGLRLSLSKFSVSVHAEETAVLKSGKLEPAELDRWTFTNLPPTEGYAAALVVEGQGFDLKTFQYPGDS